MEVLRRPTRYDPRTPREWRLCRFCREVFETEIHAITECQAHGDLIDARQCTFAARPDLPLTQQGLLDFPIAAHSDNPDDVKAIAALAYMVLLVYDGTPPFVVDPVMYDL